MAGTSTATTTAGQTAVTAVCIKIADPIRAEAVFMQMRGLVLATAYTTIGRTLVMEVFTATVGRALAARAFMMMADLAPATTVIEGNSDTYEREVDLAKTDFYGLITLGYFALLSLVINVQLIYSTHSQLEFSFG